MSKTDKFLYAGIAGIAVASLMGLLMSVFSPPKQTAEKAEETVETPTIEQQTLEPATTGDEPMPTEVPYYYIDENGNKVFLTQEEFDAGLEYEQELKRKEAERLAKEKAEQEWWESRKDWVERFPFEPTYQPEITFDPNVYAPKKRRPEEERDDAYWKMREMARNHSFLRMFYKSRLPYTEKFEQMYAIVKEVAGEKADNTILLGWTFDTLKGYHQAKAQDPEAIYRKNAEVLIRPQQLPPRPPQNMLAGLTPEQLAAYRALPERERRAMTAELRAS